MARKPIDGERINRLSDELHQWVVDNCKGMDAAEMGAILGVVTVRMCLKQKDPRRAADGFCNVLQAGVRLAQGLGVVPP